MTILVTGSSGFIGSALTKRLLEEGFTVTGVENYNDYYETSLKKDRESRYLNHKNFTSIDLNICESKKLRNLLQKSKPELVFNFAAQPGVRHSLENPSSYVQNNIVGFANLLESCYQTGVKTLVYASSSSVYGNSSATPFSERLRVDEPLNLYACSKRTNELMAHTYNHLYKMKTIGLRFFTAYGPWGRPDMALFKFTKAICEGRKLKIYNKGNYWRDFTYIDDIVEGIVRVMKKSTSSPRPKLESFYNIGREDPVQLLEFIRTLESALGLKAKMELLPASKGEALSTRADMSLFKRDFDYAPQTPLTEGIKRFVTWYKTYYSTKKSL